MALSRHHAAAARPLSVQEIVAQAQDFEFGTNRSLKNWLRSAQMLLTEAAICEQDSNLQLAYLYLYRHAELILGKLPQHPEYKDARYKDDLQQAQKTVQKNLTKLEKWKPRINQQHQRYQKALELRTAEKERVQNERLAGAHGLDSRRRSSIDSADDYYDGHADRAEPLNAYENRQLAVDLAHRELRRRDVARQSVRHAGEKMGHGVDQVGDGVREAGHHLLRRSHHDHRPNVDSKGVTSTSYHYPSVPSKEAAIDWRSATIPSTLDSRASILPPSLPAKEQLDQSTGRPPAVPPRPPVPSSTITSPPPPSQLDEASKYTFKPVAFAESGSPLRTLMLPPDLRATFLNLAHENTSRNLETCGILCGTLISNALFISHLLIPDQRSTSDTCDTTEAGDNALFDYCDANNLLVCGWIHTHPSQTCFLSSRDLHTSSGYQVMLPEAIAIVCAPRHNPDWGIFRLTDPPGLPAILNCHHQGLFHPHAETHLYTDALRPGHVVEGPGLKFEVVDLRK